MLQYWHLGFLKYKYPVDQTAIAKEKGKDTEGIATNIGIKLSQMRISRDYTAIAIWKRQIHKGTRIVAFKLSKKIHISSTPDCLLLNAMDIYTKVLNIGS